MIYIPQDAETVLGTSSPIAGSSEEANVARDYMRASAESARSYRFAIDNSDLALAQLDSEAVSQVQLAMRHQLVPGAEHLRESAETASESFKQYASAIESIHADANRVKNYVLEILEQITRHATVIDSIMQEIGIRELYSWNSPVPFDLPLPRSLAAAPNAEGLTREQELQRQHADSWRHAAWAWSEARQRANDAVTTWNRLIEERRTVEMALVDGLNATPIGSFIAMSASAGVDLGQTIKFAVSGQAHGHAFQDDGAPNPRVDAVLAACLSPEALAYAWQELNLTPDDIASLPIETLAVLADSDSLPAWVQDIAATKLLHFAVLNSEEAYRLVGFGGPESLTVAEFRNQVLGVHAALLNAKFELAIHGENALVQLLGFGSHDGALTAAISLGDLDTATNVNVNVSGMYSNPGDMTSEVNAALGLRKDAIENYDSSSYAVVSWIGYHSPSLKEVQSMERADAGSIELSSYLNGLSYNRTATGYAIDTLNVSAHSYGSTNAAEALQVIDPRLEVDNLIVYGSAGFANDINVDDIRVNQIYATEGEGDGIARWGRLGEHQADPREQDGVIVISAEGGDGYWGVSAHDMYTEDNSATIANPFGTVGYLTPNTKPRALISALLAGGKVPRELMLKEVSK